MGSKQQWRSVDDTAPVDGATVRPTEPSTPTESRHQRILGADSNEVTSFLELLEDEYVQRILEALDDDSRPARELVEACDASRATVYRRLNSLEEHGLVVTDVELHRDGHHRKVFESTLVRATIELVDGSPQVRLTLTEPVEDEDPMPERLRAD